MSASRFMDSSLPCRTLLTDGSVLVGSDPEVILNWRKQAPVELGGQSVERHIPTAEADSGQQSEANRPVEMA